MMSSMPLILNPEKTKGTRQNPKQFQRHGFKSIVPIVKRHLQDIKDYCSYTINFSIRFMASGSAVPKVKVLQNKPELVKKGRFPVIFNTKDSNVGERRAQKFQI